jgi:CelD/BcsL family acetyltransferase involved in cellulose biosynthesis
MDFTLGMTAQQQTSAAFVCSITSLAEMSDNTLMAWSELCQQNSWTGVFQRPDMVLALGSPQTQVLCIHRGSILKLVMPFEVHTQAGIRVLGMPGDAITQYSTIVCPINHETQELLECALQALRQHDLCDAVFLSNAAEHASLFSSLALRQARVSSRKTVFAPLSDYFGDKSYAPHGSFSPKKMRWSARRLEDIGTLEYHRFEAGKAPKEWIEKAVNLKLEWLKQHGDTSRLFANANLRNKFIALFTSIKNTPAVCHALSIDGEPIAVHLALETKKSSHLYFTVYDPEYSKYSPSAVLTLHQVLGYISDKIEVFDFMPPFYEYKTKWCDKTMEVYDVFLPLNNKGRYSLFALKVRLKPKLRKLFDKLPTALRNAIITHIGQ